MNYKALSRVHTSARPTITLHLLLIYSLSDLTAENYGPHIIHFRPCDSADVPLLNTKIAVTQPLSLGSMQKVTWFFSSVGLATCQVQLSVSSISLTAFPLLLYLFSLSILFPSTYPSITYLSNTILLPQKLSQGSGKGYTFPPMGSRQSPSLN